MTNCLLSQTSAKPIVDEYNKKEAKVTERLGKLSLTLARAN
jgi:hypothetical protein